MRGNNNVREVKQRRSNGGLRVEDIDTGTGDPVFAERLIQGLFIDDATARRVDNTE